MDKYAGCNIVESVVTAVPRAEVKSKRKTYAVLRIITAAVIIGLILAVRYIDLPFFAAVRDALHTVFCYDAFGREVGTSAFFG